MIADELINIFGFIDYHVRNKFMVYDGKFYIVLHGNPS